MIYDGGDSFPLLALFEYNLPALIALIGAFTLVTMRDLRLLTRLGLARQNKQRIKRILFISKVMVNVISIVDYCRM